MKSLEFYVNKTKDAFEDAVLSKDPFEKNIGDLFSENKSNYQRLAALFSIAKNVIPQALMEKYKNSLDNSTNLPFDSKNIGFSGEIARGGESIVYLLRSKTPEFPSYVFKVYRPTQHENKIDNLVEVAKERRLEYENICDTFKDMPGLIPEENFLIMNDPKKPGKGVVVSIQKFVGSDIEDIFDIKPEELQESCKKYLDLQEEIKKFVTINEKMYEEKGEMIDFLGQNNVSLMKSPEGNPHLVFIDPHHIFSQRNKEEEKIIRLNKEKFSKLENIALAF